MNFRSALLRLLCMSLSCVIMLTANAWSARFVAQRGLNLDIWTTWPGQERWDEEDVLAHFPEWRRNAGAEQLSGLREAGFDFVRMTVDPSIFLQGWGTPRTDRLLTETMTAVAQLRAAGLKVIVDLHLLPSDIRDVGTIQVMEKPELFDKYLELVAVMAKALSNEDPETVALELMNEPVIDCGATMFPKWPGMLKRLHGAAREAASGLTLVLSGGCWSSAAGLDAVDPTLVADDNVIWTFHNYEPFLLTHQGADWTGDALSYVQDLPYPPDRFGDADLRERLAEGRKRIENEAPAERRAELIRQFDNLAGVLTPPKRLRDQMEAPFDLARDWAKRNDIPANRILLGEFGMIRQEYGKTFKVPSEWRAAYLKDVVRIAEDRGFAWALWSWGGAFGITIDDESRELDPILLEGLGLASQ
ncbi:MAG: glycoside hydrolase family 5 protein [Phyllobacterium sp.]